MGKKVKSSNVSAVLALFLGWIVPGAGHVYIGRVKRGIVLFVTITATFWSGVAIGGVMTMDYEKERWWFAAEMLAGVHGLVGWQRQRAVYQAIDKKLLRDDGYVWAARDAHVDKQLAERKIALVAPADTVARAYAGVAGLLNLMCMFDALMLGLMGRVAEPPRGPAEKQAESKQP